MGIGFPELIVIFIVVIILFGPQKIPEIARAIGKGMAEFKKIADGSAFDELSRDSRKEEPPKEGPEAQKTVPPPDTYTDATYECHDSSARESKDRE